MSAVATEVRAGALWARLERPEAMNSLNWDVIAGLEQAMDEAETTPAVRALVLTGAGRAFCAGADLSLIEGSEAEPGSFERFLDAVGETMVELLRSL